MDPGLPAEDLVLTAALAARDVDEDAYWELIFEPVDRSDEETFTLAERLTRSKDSRARSVGLDVLGRLGAVDDPSRIRRWSAGVRVRRRAEPAGSRVM